MRRRTILILIAVLIILGIAGGLFLYLYFLPPPPPPSIMNSSVELNVLDSGVLDYGSLAGSLPSKVIFLLTRVNGRNITNANISVKLYDSELPRDIYLLDYSSPGFPGCTECDGLPDFTKSLEATIKKYGLLEANSTINQIKINHLDKLTRRSIIVVPTGKIPAQLVGMESGPDLNDLMRRGFVVIFLGRDLDEAFYANGSVVRIPSDRLTSYGISYIHRDDLSTCEGYRLQNPSFVVSAKFENLVACSMSYVQKGEGYLFVLPRSIDIGWNANGQIAGEDVGRLIYEIRWKDPLTTGMLSILAQRINESNSNTSMIFMAPYANDSGWTRIFVNATTLNGSTLYFVTDKKITNPVKGKIIHIPQGVGDDKILIDFQFSEDFPKLRDVNISVVVYKDMQRFEKQFAHSIKIKTEYLFSSYFIVDLPIGNYTLRAEDDDGYVYAQSFLNVPPINVTIAPTVWSSEPQIFQFSALVPKYIIPRNSIESSKLAPLTYRVAYLTINKTPGKNLFPPYLNVSGSDGVFSFAQSPSLDYGLYTFKVNISRQIIIINQTNSKPASWLDNPINVAIIVITILVAVVAIALRRPEKPVYTLDVPDFPPLEKVVVPISKFSVLSLFDSVNKEYKWSFMPLSPQELKNEMRRKITYKGVPVLITDYNLDKILEELIESGDVAKALNFYGLKTWETKSGRDMRYLALFRLLRNFLINNAIPFTDLNQRKDCGILATVKGEGFYIHIYTDENTLKRALELTGAGKNFIVFESKKELEETVKKLDLSYNSLAVIIKSEIGIGKLQLVHPGNFSEMLGR
ncbi:hypothetical protein H0N98_00710 [Candidatus Micrarchaeota archaeon]|nr:hypothetical protein [Candidatus Micrarchaeota archaeon]